MILLLSSKNASTAILVSLDWPRYSTARVSKRLLMRQPLTRARYVISHARRCTDLTRLEAPCLCETRASRFIVYRVGVIAHRVVVSGAAGLSGERETAPWSRRLPRRPR